MSMVTDEEEVTLLMPRARSSHSRVDWSELRVIATEVQRALDASSKIEPHSDYENVFAMWQAELGDIPNRLDESDVEQEALGQERQELTWYSSAHKYWNDEVNCPLSDDGVLGGFAHVSGVDIRESRRFLKLVHDTIRPDWECRSAVDCGAGIGRVSKLLLLPMFEHVDLVEQSPRLLRGVPQYLGADESLRARVRDLYCMGLQDFEPTTESYDLIWMQWVLVHLTDVDLVRYLRRCKRALTPHGFIVIKENIFQTAEPYDLDRQDSSITRSAVYYKSLFKQAGLTLLAERRQRHFPEELYPVKMYALA
ncbi:Alpha N-terminal protein methyltransferase 1B [Phytophthora boehmeriae]|uniref:Alpha N-terminal protein methyltransferase 1B n=1 Tax=Phytophthora boehmeriae TaxID=109152 RepID=A0A8T1X3I2_9STRA|nr:Alpha N-terminal protein methyltransferase 1B [Phytophthora boehmeriae]